MIIESASYFGKPGLLLIFFTFMETGFYKNMKQYDTEDADT